MIHPLHKARFLIPPSDYYPSSRFIIDLPVIKRLTVYESIFYYMADRMDLDGWHFSSTQRRRFFYRTIKYWCDVLLDFNVDLVISRNVPHFPSEYGLYIACQLLNCPFAMGDIMATLGRSWVITSIEERSQVVKKTYHETKSEISIDIVSILEKQRSDYNVAVPDYFIKSKMQNTTSEKNSFLVHLRLINAFILALSRFYKSTDLTMVVSKKPISNCNSMPNRIQDFLIRFKARLKILKNKKIYQQLSRFPEIGREPYIYFAPNYQPERTTLPDAGVFADVLRVLDLISAVLPKDWLIYYKEHPSIFNVPVPSVFWRGHMYRNLEFYQNVAEYNNVRILPVEIDSFKLIDNAKCTVTATGTVALESAMRGTPGVVFGSVWFDGIEGVVRAETKEDLIGLFNKIEAGYKPDQAKIANYLQAAWECSSPKYPNLLLSQVAEADRKEYRKKIDAMLKDYLKFLPVSGPSSSAQQSM